MREGTKVVHRAAETSVFTKRFLKGEINVDEYGRYINSLYFIYNSMEELLEKHKEHPTVNLIHFPTELNRKQALINDLGFFYGKDLVDTLTDPRTITPAVKKYVAAMEEACQKNPALLIAHSYSRYLGDLSGGQILSKRLKKSVLKYDENDSLWDSTEGLEFYHFDKLGNQTEFKNFYRERLNAAKVNASTRELVVSEAVKSFELNIALFDEIQELSDANQLVATSVKISETAVVSERTQELNTPKETKTNYIPWILVSVATVAAGVELYRRYKK
ncbi:heme oxygenase-domain-containing protein [Sporodiniella umbellata]|nr:heme oxygenase-domain-containing protein [Sporodiniella umbellata]